MISILANTLVVAVHALDGSAAADRLIDAARAVQQGTGPLSEPAVDPSTQDGVVGYRRTEATPEVDQRPHRLAS